MKPNNITRKGVACYTQTLTAIIMVALTLTACGEKGGNTLKDPRDGKKYRTVKIGEQVWMAENLNYAADGSRCYDDKPENCDKYGSLYSWNTAKTICPSEWHLPSNDEWIYLEIMAGGDTAGKNLKTKEGWKTNPLDGKSGNGDDVYGFSALPGGWYDDGSFNNVDIRGIWWTASESASARLNASKSGTAYARVTHYNSDEASYYYDIDKPSLLSIRCVLDDAATYSAVKAAVDKKTAEDNILAEEAMREYLRKYAGEDADIAATESECKGDAKLLGEIATGEAIDDNEDVGTESGNFYYATLFKYDAQSRIVSIFNTNGDGYGTEQILVYSGNDLATVKTVEYSENGEDTSESKIVRNGNTISIGDDSITINSYGHIVRHENRSYQYLDGNLVRETALNDGKEEVTEYKYGNKKSLFYNSNTPKWIIQYFIRYDYAGKNNSIGGNDNVYKYDSDGFLTKTIEPTGDSKYMTMYRYSCEQGKD
jgi:uncharacterized protein (TIGR02145 family)